MTLVVAAVLLPPILATLFFAIEIFAGLRPLGAIAGDSDRILNTVVVVPAHNEAAIIGGTVSKLRSELDAKIALLVIADNCTDETASLARIGGAEVIERTDPSRRGKGFALDFARAHLRNNPPDVVLVLDADCSITRTSVDALIAACAATERPCQAIYLLLPAPEQSTIVQISTFAFFLKNLVRQRGLQRLAGQVHLTGTGMMFPWSVFNPAPLASGSIVEDLELGIILAAKGKPPHLVEQARVWSPAASETATTAQRSRWEGGFIATMRNAAPGALSRAMRHGSLPALCASLDLCVPPFTLLMITNAVAMSAGAALIALSGASWWPLIALSVAIFLAATAVVAAWYREGRRFVGGRVLAGAPLYVAWKFSLYLGLAREGVPKEWRRTDRNT